MVGVVASRGRPMWQSQLCMPREIAAQAVSSALGGTGAYASTRRDNRAVEQWALSGGSADADILPNLETVRRQSRDLVRNQPLAEGAIATNVTSVVGTGIRPKATVDAAFLGLDEAAKDRIERQIERVWKLWAGSTDCDVAQRMNFYGMQGLVLRSALENGDAFALRRFKERPRALLGLCLQLVEGDRCATPFHRILDERLCGGIEVDADGAPVAYFFRNRHPGDLRFLADSLRYTRVAARAPSGLPWVVHVMDPKRIGQTRAMPYLAPVIQHLKQLSRYTEAELMATVLSSFFTVILSTDTGDGGHFVRPGDDPAGAADPGEIALGQGAIVDAGPNAKVNFADPSRPNTSFEGFVLAVMRQIGPALELPHEILVKHFTASYSASRGALLEAWRYFRRRRRWLIERFCDPVYEWVVTEAVARGSVVAPGYFDDPLVRAAYLGNEWVGDPIGQIDPLKETNAAVKQLDNDLTTHTRVAAELNGQDWEGSVQPQRRREQRLLDASRAADPASQGPGADGTRAVQADGSVIVYRDRLGWVPDSDAA